MVRTGITQPRMSDWVYISLSIQAAHKFKDEMHAISGSYIYNRITLSHHVIALDSAKDATFYEYQFTSKPLITKTEISWIPIRLVDIKWFQDSAGEVGSADSELSFAEFIGDLVDNDGFEFKPFELSELKVLLFKIDLNTNSLPLFPIEQFEPIEFTGYERLSCDSDSNIKIMIECCPFSQTNVALFMNFKLYGDLVYRINSGKDGYLSDLKYLDNIIGSVVKLQNNSSNSIGLVGGYLNKINGDGNLLIILSWNLIFALLKSPKLQLTTSGLPKGHLDAADGYGVSLASSVVRISIRTRSEEYFWGSGVVVSKEFIITNEHVLNLGNLKGITVHFSNSNNDCNYLTEKDIEIIKPPIKGYDLVFLRLKFDKSNINLNPVQLCEDMNDIRAGSNCTSVGYGLFFNKGNFIKPICSTGYVNSMIYLNKEILKEQLGMIIVNSSCWNGSSGGGLFNDKNQFIGLMTSNGKLSSGEIMTKFSLIIPVNIIKLNLKMINLNLGEIDLNSDLKNLWSLRSNHYLNKEFSCKF